MNKHSKIKPSICDAKNINIKLHNEKIKETNNQVLINEFNILLIGRKAMETIKILDENKFSEPFNEHKFDEEALTEQFLNFVKFIR